MQMIKNFIMTEFGLFPFRNQGEYVSLSSWETKLKNEFFQQNQRQHRYLQFG